MYGFYDFALGEPISQSLRPNATPFASRVILLTLSHHYYNTIRLSPRSLRPPPMRSKPSQHSWCSSKGDIPTRSQQRLPTSRKANLVFIKIIIPFIFWQLYQQKRNQTYYYELDGKWLNIIKSKLDGNSSLNIIIVIATCKKKKMGNHKYIFDTAMHSEIPDLYSDQKKSCNYLYSS
jgi:hypothetical protein